LRGLEVSGTGLHPLMDFSVSCCEILGFTTGLLFFCGLDLVVSSEIWVATLQGTFFLNIEQCNEFIASP
jgi:hypothetical protein